MARAREDLTGQVFGRLTAIERVGYRSTPNGTRNSYWRCKCECGKEKSVRISHLKSGSIRSCGCLTHRSETVFPEAVVPTTVDLRLGGWIHEYALTGKKRPV